jgi:hypothetical protein
MATLKDAVNDMVYKLRLFSSEVTRVSLDVGTMGQLGGQAVVTGVEGTWKTCELHCLRSEGEEEVADVDSFAVTETVRTQVELVSTGRD